MWVLLQIFLIKRPRQAINITGFLGLQRVSEIRTVLYGFQTLNNCLVFLHFFFIMCLKSELSGFNFRHFCEMSEIRNQRLVFRHMGVSEIWTHKSLDFRQAQISDIYCIWNMYWWALFWNAYFTPKIAKNAIEW